MKQKLLVLAASLAWNAAFVAGSCLVIFGVALMHRPSACIVAGLEITVISFLGGIDQARNSWRMEEEE